MADIKNYSQNKGHCNDKSILPKSYIFLHKNACERTYIDIYVDLLSITFIYSVLLHGAYHQIVKSTVLATNILKPMFLLSNTISVLSNYTLFMPRKPT